MSIPQRKAVIEFMDLFTPNQKINLEVKLRYISGNYNIVKNVRLAKENFIFVLINGEINLKIRSLLKLIFIMFKIIILRSK